MFQPTSLSHADVAAEVRNRLAGSPYLPIRRVSVDCDRGVVCLRGRLPSYYYKQLAQETLRGLAGVSQVENKIEVPCEQGTEDSFVKPRGGGI